MSEKKIEVAYVINSVLVAGAEMMLLETASHLDRERFSPVVYVLRDYGEGRPSLASRFTQAGVPLVYLAPAKRLGIVDAVKVLRRQFKNSRPDIIHCHLPDAVISGGVVAAILHIPFVIHEHQTHRFHSWKVRMAYRILRMFAALTITYAETLETELFGDVCVLSGPPERLDRASYTVHNGIDIDHVERVSSTIDRGYKRRELGFSPEDIVIVSVARFVEWKGHQLLIEAFASVFEEIPRARLLLIGDGPLYTPLSARVVELGLQNRIHLPGARSDIYEILASLDIFSLDFVYPVGLDAEAIGVAGFEAMAFGLPVIVGDYIGARTYIGNNERGVIVEPRDQEALAQAIVNLVKDPDRCRRLGEAAKIFAKRELNWNSLIKIYERIYTLMVNL